MTTTMRTDAASLGRATPHRWVVRRVLPAPPVRYEEHPTGRHPRLLATFSIVVVGTMLGGAIGATTGAAVGVWFFVVGALYGAPVGAVVGAAVGLPASIALAASLHLGRPSDPDGVARRTATTLAALWELLVAAELTGALAVARGVHGAHRAEDAGRAIEAGAGVFLLILAAIIVYGWLDLHLLRWAARHLADEWNDLTGWTAVRR